MSGPRTQGITCRIHTQDFRQHVATQYGENRSQWFAVDTNIM